VGRERQVAQGFQQEEPRQNLCALATPSTMVHGSIHRAESETMWARPRIFRGGRRVCLTKKYTKKLRMSAPVYVLFARGAARGGQGRDHLSQGRASTLAVVRATRVGGLSRTIPRAVCTFGPGLHRPGGQEEWPRPIAGRPGAFRHSGHRTVKGLRPHHLPKHGDLGAALLSQRPRAHPK